MEILLKPTSNKLMVGYEWMIDNEFLNDNTFKITLTSDMLIDFQIKFSILIGETVTYWFTLIVLSALRRFDNENMLSLMNLILSGTESGKQDTSSSSGNYLTHVVDADIGPINDQVLLAEVQLTAQHNVLTNEQHHIGPIITLTLSELIDPISDDDLETAFEPPNVSVNLTLVISSCELCSILIPSISLEDPIT
nr:hypothetical protein [Tanacetum cinerariifolium]